MSTPIDGVKIDPIDKLPTIAMTKILQDVKHITPAGVSKRWMNATKEYLTMMNKTDTYILQLQAANQLAMTLRKPSSGNLTNIQILCSQKEPSMNHIEALLGTEMDINDVYMCLYLAVHNKNFDLCKVIIESKKTLLTKNNDDSDYDYVRSYVMDMVGRSGTTEIYDMIYNIFSGYEYAIYAVNGAISGSNAALFGHLINGESDNDIDIRIQAAIREGITNIIQIRLVALYDVIINYIIRKTSRVGPIVHTLIKTAIEHNNPVFVKKMLPRYQLNDLDIRLHEDVTLLAAQRDRYDIVEFLLIKYGANRKIKNSRKLVNTLLNKYQAQINNRSTICKIIDKIISLLPDDEVKATVKATMRCKNTSPRPKSV